MVLLAGHHDNITYPLEIPPPAEKPPLTRSTTFITKSILSRSAMLQQKFCISEQQKKRNF